MSDDSTAADYVLDTLKEYGVRRIFGNPGTTELPLMKALERSSIEYELALHEDVAVGMAAGYASAVRYRRDSSIPPLGVVNLHAVGGLTHGLGNLYGAFRSGVPMVVTAGAQSTDYRHREPILTGDMVKLTEEFTKWSDEVLTPEALPHLLRRAVRRALAPPTGPVFLSLPLNVMEEPFSRAPLELGDSPVGAASPPEKIETLARKLEGAESPIFVLGDSLARHGRPAFEAITQLTEETGAMVFGEILAAEASFPTDHEQWMSFLPPDGELVSELLDTDLVVLVGCGSNTPLFRDGDRLIPDSTDCVHVHSDPFEIGKNERVNLALYGDLVRSLEKLNETLEGRIDAGTRKKRLGTARSVKELIDARFESYVSNDPVPDRCSKPQVVSVLRERMDDCFLVDEGVTGRYALLREWPMQAERYLSNKGGALGYGLPASAGVALALEDHDDSSRVLAYVGDGSFWYYPQTLYSAARRSLPLTVLILNNQGYTILKEKLEEFYGFTDSLPGMDLDGELSSAQAAASQGIRSETVRTIDGLDEALTNEQDSEGPGLIEVMVHD